MKVELGRIGSVKQGLVLNRVKPKEGEESKTYPLLTIGRLLQEEEGITCEEVSVAEIGFSKMDNLKLSKEGMILIGLTSFHKAVVLTKELEGMIIPSNFLILEFPGGIMDAHYFAWYFNESPKMQKLKEGIINGTGKVKVLSIQQIRTLKIDVPDLVTQMAIGNLYSLQLNKNSLLKQVLRLEMQHLTKRMNQMIDPADAGQKTDMEQLLDAKYKQLDRINRRMEIYERELTFS